MSSIFQSKSPADTPDTSPVFLVIPSKLTTEHTGNIMQELARFGTPLLCSGDMRATESMVDAARAARKCRTGSIRPLICVALLAPLGKEKITRLTLIADNNNRGALDNTSCVPVGRGIYDTLRKLAPTSRALFTVHASNLVNSSPVYVYAELSRDTKDFRDIGNNWHEEYGTIRVLRTSTVYYLDHMLQDVIVFGRQPVSVINTGVNTTPKHKIHLAASLLLPNKKT